MQIYYAAYQGPNSITSGYIMTSPLYPLCVSVFIGILEHPDILLTSHRVHL